MAAQGRPCLLPHACAMGTSSAPSPRSHHHRASAPWPPPASSHRGGSQCPQGAMATMVGPIHLFPCTITATVAETSPLRGGWGHRRWWRRQPRENARRREGGQGATPARRPSRRGASREREHVPGAWRGGPGRGRRGRGRGGGEVEPGCGRGDRRFPPPSAPHLAGPPLARGPVPRGEQASPAGPPRRSSRRRRAASPPPAGSGPSRRRRRLPLHGRRSRRLHCGKLTSLAAAAAPPAPALTAMGAVTDGETSLLPSSLPPRARRPAPRPPARPGSAPFSAGPASPPAPALRGRAPRAPASGLPPSPSPGLSPRRRASILALAPTPQSRSRARHAGARPGLGRPPPPGLSARAPGSLSPGAASFLTDPPGSALGMAP